MKKINPKVTTVVMILLGILVAGGATLVDDAAGKVAQELQDTGDTGI